MRAGGYIRPIERGTLLGGLPNHQPDEVRAPNPLFYATFSIPRKNVRLSPVNFSKIAQEAI